MHAIRVLVDKITLREREATTNTSDGWMHASICRVLWLARNGKIIPKIIAVSLTTAK